MSYNLTAGALTVLMKGGQVEKPIVQILSHKLIQGSAERYRIMISDSQNFHSYFMLATQLNERLVKGELENFTVVRLDRYLTNTTPANKLLFIILDFTVIRRGSEVRQKIGNPMQIGATDSESEASHSNIASQQLSKFPAPNPLSNPSNRINQYNANISKVSMSNDYSFSNKTDMSIGNTHPISSLTPYQNKWTIKARVTNKSNIRTWNNSRGEGRLFSMDLVDESGEIRATVFTDLVDKFYNTMEINKVYYISKAVLKTANKNFSSIKNDYEMTFGPETTVVLCNDDSNVPKMQFNFILIKQLENIEKDTLVDVIGVCKSASDTTRLVSRQNNRELIKRDIHLIDQSQSSVTLTLWANEAETFDGSNNPVIAVKGAKLSDFNGRSLSTVMASRLQINPDIKEAFILKSWFEREGSHLQVESISGLKGGLGGGSFNTNWKTFGAVKSENLGTGDKPDYYNVKGTVVLLKKENCLYQACPSNDCNKKVTDMGNGSYRCEKCNREYPNFKWRILLNANFADFSDSQWATCFQDTGEILLGKSAEELGNLREQDPSEFDKIFSEAPFKDYIFKLRTKMESYNDESRLKSILMAAMPLNYKEYNQKLISDINKMSLD